ncbi:MAG TPA: Ldh family oxidoreductase [Chloroflexota bacterium]|jgi:LDH2 family malate/lactate/ureidoglycolate dehydrogenase|nr:Ldh family oxidoreductase [Chloroflexota bacterium]
MPNVHAEELEHLIRKVLEGVGASAPEAATVARHMVGANLAGHDSHGVQLLPGYVANVRRGHTVPGAPFEILEESPATARVDGHWGFGQVVSERAMELAIVKARVSNVAALTVRRQAHVGRVADYPLMAARAGLIGIMCCDSGRTAKQVVPFGGREPRLGTNPLCIALPSDLEGPVFLDMATSQAAGNKIAVYRKRGQSLPPGWIVDAAGRPSTDPADFFAGGAILPLGGAQGHKGYGLSFMVEVFAGILTGLGFGVDPSGRHNDGALMLVLNVAAFRPPAEFRAEVTAFARYVKETPPAPGTAEVLYPGELEWRTEQERRQDGIPVEDETWEAVTQLLTS